MIALVKSAFSSELDSKDAPDKSFSEKSHEFIVFPERFTPLKSPFFQLAVDSNCSFEKPFEVTLFKPANLMSAPEKFAFDKSDDSKRVCCKFWFEKSQEFKLFPLKEIPLRSLDFQLAVDSSCSLVNEGVS